MLADKIDVYKSAFFNPFDDLDVELFQNHTECFDRCPKECESYSYEITSKPKAFGHELMYKYLKETRPALANTSLQEIESYVR